MIPQQQTQQQTVYECPVCALVTSEKICPRCKWEIVGQISLGNPEPLNPFEDDPVLTSAKRHWNLRAAVTAAGPGTPDGKRIERLCKLAGIPPDFWRVELPPLLYETEKSAAGDVSFTDTLLKSAHALDAKTGQALVIVELSLNGVAQCRVSKSKWDTLRRTKSDMASWHSIIPVAPSAPNELRFFLAGGRLDTYPSGQTVIGFLDDWLRKTAPDRAGCTSIVVWNRLPGWVIPELLIERMGKHP